MTKHIGLIGGIGPAASDFYYRRLIRVFSERQTDLDLTLVHGDAPTLLANLAKGDALAQARIFARLTERLAKAGADLVVVTSIAGHFCAQEFAALSPLPVVDMIQAVDSALKTSGFKRIGILGTRTVMTTRFYGGISSADIVAPMGDDLDRVHAAYAEMAVSGIGTDQQRAIFFDAAHRLIDQEQVDAIMLGGTDLALVFNPENASFPLVDCAAIHVDQIVDRAIGHLPAL